MCVCQGGTEPKERDVIKVGGREGPKTEMETVSLFRLSQEEGWHILHKQRRQEFRTAQCKVIKRSGYLAFKCPSSAFPRNALHSFVSTLIALCGTFLIMCLSLPYSVVSRLVLQYRGFWGIWTLHSHCYMRWRATHRLLPASTFARYLCAASHSAVLQLSPRGDWDSQPSSQNCWENEARQPVWSAWHTAYRLFITQ